jgi:sulfite oxidase
METRTKSGTTNRPDEWIIEQGMAAHKLPILDQTAGKDTVKIFPPKPYKITQDKKAIQAVGDRSKLFARERKGWVGYVYPALLDTNSREPS